VNEPPGQWRTAVVAMQERMASLEARVARLEVEGASPAGPHGEPDFEAPPVSSMAEIQGPLSVMMGTPSLIGRSLLVLAGAFLLRALTESGTFAPLVGVLAGVAYAALWIIAAAVAARRGARTSAGFFAACSAVIVGPLLLEAVASFGVFSPAGGVAVLTVLTMSGLVVSARWHLQWTAWIFSIFGIVTAAAVATVRPPGEAATAFLVMLGLAVLWLADRREWNLLKWLSGLAADLAVLRLTAIAVAPGARPEHFGPVHPPLIAVLQFVLVAGYAGTAVCQALRGRRRLPVFAFVQTALVALVGWGGGLQLARVQGWSITGLSLCAVVAAAAAYGGAFGVVDRRQGKNRAFVFLSSMGLVLVVIGLPGVIPRFSAVVWSLVAVAVAGVGVRWDRVTLRVHAAVLLLAAWVSSGVGKGIVSGLSARAQEGRVSVEAIPVAILTIVTTVVVLRGSRKQSSAWVQRLPLTGMLAMSACVISSGLASGAEALLGFGTARVAGTIALSAVTVGLAGLASRWKLVEPGWLVYPFLVVTAIRMLTVDLVSGHTLVLVIALTAYGTALIVSTWLLRRARTL